MNNEFGTAPATDAAGQLDRAGSVGIGPRNGGIARPYLLVGVATILAVALYAVIGGPNVVTVAPRGATQAMGDSGEAGTKLPSVGNLLDGLKTRLEKNPADGDGWLLLAKSYRHLGRIPEARDAYANAVANGSSETEFESLLSTSSPADTDTAGIALHGRVSIPDSLGGSLSPDASVFVTAKSGDGSPMPLAVIRRTVADIPFDFELTDDQSMVRGRSLSSASDIIVSAKISSAGDALNADPGLETSVGPFPLADAGFLELRIDPAVH